MQFLQKILEKTTENLEVILIAAAFLTFAWHFLLESKRFFCACLMLVYSVLVICIYGGVLDWLRGLGGDSFLESNNFDVNEAFFWLYSFLTSLLQMLTPPKVTAMMAAEVLVISILTYQIIRWRPKLLGWLAVALLAGHLNLLYAGYVGFEAGRSYVKTLEGKFSHNPTGFKTSEDIDLFVYIGESTTTLNMSLYGYPLPTTPRLDALFQQDKGFLRFDKVRSTHTHTSLSLLRALAVTSPQAGGRITQWGIGNVLKSAGLKPQLLSVQPLNGSFATFSKFIFEGANLDLPKNDRYKGNLSTPKVKDHQMLETALTKTGVVFFHSYAGHFDYLNLIESSMSQAIAAPPIRFDGMFGSSFSESLNGKLSNEVSDYDRAITYIDRNVARAIENIKNRTKPSALIYFSDHGDAVYTKRGHESSKFIDEMSTIPMVLYFNDAYRTKYPDVFTQYQIAARDTRTRILDQVSSTVLDVLHIKSELPMDIPTLASNIKHPRPYIMQRNTLSGDSRINLEYDEALGFSKVMFFGGIPEPTYVSIINERFGRENSICYHRADSFSKALRAASIADCLEFDLVVEGDALFVHHPPATATGFSIDHIFGIAQARKNKLWIDAKNLDDLKACQKLTSYLEVNHDRVGQILVEFPWSASLKLAELDTCGKNLKSIGIRTSYYIPTQLLIPCVEDSVKNAGACSELELNVQKAMASGIFSDLSFDFLGYPIVKQIKGTERFKWNTWAVRVQDFHTFPRKEFDSIIMDSSSDPNTY